MKSEMWRGNGKSLKMEIFTYWVGFFYSLPRTGNFLIVILLFKLDFSEKFLLFR